LVTIFCWQLRHVLSQGNHVIFLLCTARLPNWRPNWLFAVAAGAASPFDPFRLEEHHNPAFVRVTLLFLPEIPVTMRNKRHVVTVTSATI
jgi:hypothetical protein